MKRPMIEYIIEALEPTFAEMMGPDKSYYEDYSCNLTMFSVVLKERLDKELQYILKHYFSNSGTYNAACDVASCLESLCPEEYAGVFKY